MIRAIFALLTLLAAPALALELELPVGARLTVERDTNPDVYAAPVDTFEAGALRLVRIEGDVRRSAWRIDSRSITPLQVMRPLRHQLEAAGFDIVLDCAADACGGFDFRFAVETLPGPNMYVNIRAYHFVTALRGLAEAPEEVVTILTSTSAASAHVQIIQAGALAEGEVAVATTADLPVTAQPAAQDDLAGQLLANGHVVLSDLEFEIGSSDLGPGPFASLQTLARFLEDQGNLRIALVGHTDSVGSLQGNIALSKRRAASVRQRLINGHNVPAERMEAEGMGYLAPVASNLQEQGRDQNRRVEVILLGVE